MSIAFDAASQVGDTQATTKTWSHTTGSGSNRVMAMFVQIEPAGQVSGTPTYNGVSMTQRVAWQGGGAVFNWSYAYTLVAPSTGANNVSVTSSVATRYIYAAAGTYTGVDQTNPIGSTAVTATNAASSSTSLTTSLTTNVDNAWLVGMGGVGTGGGGVAAGTGTTRRATSYGFYNWHALLDSDGAKTPTGSYSLIHTGSSERRMMTMIQIVPPSATFIPRVSFIM